MRAKLKYIHSPDIDDIKNLGSTNHYTDLIFIQAFIGPANDIGEESFDITFCTPIWIEKEIEKYGFKIARSLVIVKKIDYEVIFNIINNLCNRVSGSDWGEIANKLNRYFYWEFENYVEKK